MTSRFDEIEKNDFNLDIPLHIHAFEEEEVDLRATQKKRPIEDLTAGIGNKNKNLFKRTGI